MSVPSRRIGSLTVSAIGLGCMNLSHAYGVPPDPRDAARLLDHALEIGIDFLDTAALYGGGHNEMLLAQTVMDRRSRFVLASKCVLGIVDGKRVLDGSPAGISASIDRSLTNLSTDYIDLMYLHRRDFAVPIEDSVGALVRAIEAGKIGAIGLSEMSAGTVRRAHAVHPVCAVQSEYSPWVRNPEVAVLAACRELGIGFVAFSPLGRGIFAGAVRTADFHERDIRLSMPRFREPNLAHNLVAIARYEALAASLGMSPAQLSLAWVLARAEHIAAIPGTTNSAHLEENLAAAMVALPPEAVAAVDGLLAGDAIRGPRYDAGAQRQIDTELLPGEQVS